MSDTATLTAALRILARDIHCEDGIATQCIAEAADAIEQLREKETALLAAGDKLEQQLVTVAQQRDALRLTDEEREAIERAIGRELDAEWYGGPEPDRVVALRGLLERLG